MTTPTISDPSLSLDSPVIRDFMAKVSQDLGTSLPAPKDIFSFGDDDARVTKELTELALAGRKTATTSFPVPQPQHWDVGDLSVGLDENKKPCFVMRTTELRVVNFEDVDASFAADEGEGDLSLEYYKSAHQQWYKDKIGTDGRKFGDGIGRPVLCERFEIIWPQGVYQEKKK